MTLFGFWQLESVRLIEHLVERLVEIDFGMVAMAAHYEPNALKIDI